MFCRLALLASLVLAGCTATTIPDAAIGSYKTIGLIVEPATQIPSSSMGITVFDNEGATVNATSLDIEGMLRRESTRVLSRRFRVVDIPYVHVGGNRWVESVNAIAAKEVAASVAAVPDRADLYLIISQYKREDPLFTGRRLDLSGCGIFHLDNIFEAKPPLAYCVLGLVAVDGKTMHPVASGSLELDSGSSITPNTTAYAVMDGVIWTGPALTPEQLAGARKAFEKAIAESMPYSLREMKLAQ